MSVTGRVVLDSADPFQLPEPGASYKGRFEPEKSDIGAENTYFWDDYLDDSGR